MLSPSELVKSQIQHRLHECACFATLDSFEKSGSFTVSTAELWSICLLAENYERTYKTIPSSMQTQEVSYIDLHGRMFDVNLASGKITLSRHHDVGDHDDGAHDVGDVNLASGTPRREEITM